MSNRLFALIGVLPLLPSVAQAGMSVGDPVPLRFASSPDLVITGGTLSITDIHVNRCNGVVDHYEVDLDFDVVEQDTLLIPSGDVCGIDLDLDGPLVVTGHHAQHSGTFTLTLQVGVVHVNVAPVLHVENNQSDADWVEIANPNWVTGGMLGLDAGEQITVSAPSTLHNQIRDRVRNQSSVVR